MTVNTKREITGAKAINEALREELARDERVYFIGEDIALYHSENGPCGVSTGLLREFGDDRVIETPISEGVIVGSSVGAAMFGMRPVVEIMHSEFLATCVEHIVYGGSKAAFNSGSVCPLVIRTPCGGTAPNMPVQNENNEAWFANTPGLKIVIPSNAYDAKGLLKSAIRDDYPVLFLEHKAIYKTPCPVPEEEYLLPLGKAEVKRPGTDVSLITYGNTVNTALRAAEALEKEGVSLEVVDLRTVLPMDEETVLASVRRTGRAIVSHEARQTGGLGGEVCAVIAEKAFSSLKAPVLRVCGPDVLSNYPRTEAEIAEAVKRLMEYK